MPHFVIEEGNAFVNIEQQQKALELAVECGEKSGLMDVKDIKARIQSYPMFLAGDGRKSFIHITVSLLEGRSDDQKESLAILLRTAFVGCFSKVESISVDIRDMNPVPYKKYLMNSHS